ncbi:MAG: SGNH/GDSL hydrolase family protein [Pirellulales bacterium]
MLLDATVACARGWRLESDRMVGLILGLGALYVTLVLSLLTTRRTRAFLARAPQLLAFGLSILIGLLTAELMVLFVWPQGSYHCRPPEAVYTFDPDPYTFPGVSGEARSTICNRGFRAPPLPPRSAATRVLCVGGSTTECLMLDDSESWPARVAAALDKAGRHYWIGAAGHCDNATGHHLRFIKNSRQIAEVDCLVVLAGAGDYVRGLLQLESGEYAPPLFVQSHLMMVAKTIWNVQLGRGFLIDRTGREWLALRRHLPIDPQALDLDDYLIDYEGRLREIVSAARRRGKRLILVTQPVLWDDFLNPAALQQMHIARDYVNPRGSGTLTPAECLEVMDRFNAVMLRVAEETGTEIVDAAVAMNGVEKYFYDDFHLNEAGCQALGNLVASQIEGK